MLLVFVKEPPEACASVSYTHLDVYKRQPVPLRCRETEQALKGMKIGEELYTNVKELVRKEINPRNSWRASRAFRLQIGGEIAARALEESIRLQGGDRA